MGAGDHRTASGRVDLCRREDTDTARKCVGGMETEHNVLDADCVTGGNDGEGIDSCSGGFAGSVGKQQTCKGAQARWVMEDDVSGVVQVEER